MKPVHTHPQLHGLVGQFLVITGLSALVVMWAVNAVTPIVQSSVATPLMGLLLVFVAVGLFFHVKSAR